MVYLRINILVLLIIRVDDKRKIFFKKLRSDDNKKMKKSFCLKTNSDMNIRDHNDKIIVPKELNLKNIQKIIRIPITPKCQLKCDTFSEKQLHFCTLKVLRSPP
jgi:hypothetical protein